MEGKEKLFIGAQEICDLVGCKLCKAYGIIRQLNEELRAQGKITIRGKTSRKFFLSKI